MSQSERAKYILGFQRGLDVRGEPVPARYHCRFLVTTTGIFQEGVTLHKACELVLMEPLFLRGWENQALARVQRIGQRNERVHTFRLLNPQSDPEMAILATQGCRGSIIEPAMAKKVEGWLNKQPDAFRALLEGDG